MQHIRSVTIFGSAFGNGGELEYDAAFSTAKLLAESNIAVVNGGGPGIMMAATQGAHAGGGDVTAVFLEPQHATTFRGSEHHVIAEHIYSEKNYIDRTQKLMELGDAYIFFNGGTGTLSEFAMCWVVARIYFGHHKPLILYGKFWREIIETFVKNMKIRPEELRVVKVVTHPQDVITALEQFEDLIEHDRRLLLSDSDVEKALLLV